MEGRGVVNTERSPSKNAVNAKIRVKEYMVERCGILLLAIKF